MRNSSNKIILTLILGIFLISLTSAIDITRLAPTTDIFITNESTVNISYSIHAPDGVSSITHSVNGTNYTLYDSSLVLFMNFDNRSALGENDTIVRDLSMYKNNGSVVGGENITWGSTYGKYGGAFNQSGKKSYIKVDISEQLNITGNFTIVAWIKPTACTNLVNGIVSKGNSAPSNLGYTLDIDNNCKIEFSVFGLTDTFMSGASKVFTAGQWNMITVTYDGSYLKGYKNMDLDIADDTSGNVSLTPTQMYIGARSWTQDTTYFNGSIDNVMIFNRSLSQNEITYLYNTQITKYNSTYWEYNTSFSLDGLPQPHFLCSVNSTNDNFCSTQGTSRNYITVKSNFSDSIGIIKNDFYTMSSYVPHGSEHLWIDTNNDNVLDTLSNYTWHRENMKNANIQTIRLYLWTDQISVSEGVLNTTATFNNYKNINSIKSWVDYAKLNDMNVLLSVFGTPRWLANQTSGWCNISNQPQANWTCPPSNYTKYGELVVDALDYIGCDANTCKVAIWNEPDYEGSWLNNISRYSYIRSIEYNKLYNATWIEIKKSYPNMKVGGPVTTSSITRVNSLVFSNWSSNFSNQTDFVELHSYLQQANTNYSNYGNMLNFDLPFYMGIIARDNGNVTDYFYTELNIHNSSSQVLNTSAYSSYRGMQIGSAINYFLNSYPNNVSMGWYQWSEEYNYLGSVSGQKMQIVSEPLLNNTKDIVYYVYSNISHIHPSGADVKVTSSDSDCIKQVSSVKGNLYAITLINTCDRSQNVTLNLSRENGTMIYPYRTLVNYEDEDIKYKISDANTVENLLFDSYDILYLRSGEESGATLRGLYKLNEYSGNTVYDSRINISNGTISGASWVTDGVLNKIPTSKYTINLNSGLTSLSNDYLYEYLTVSYNTVADKTSLNALTSIENSGSTVVNFLPLVFLVIIFGAILFLVLRFLIPYIELGQNINKF